MVSKGKRTSNEELLELAIQAAKDGNLDGARVMLRQVLGHNKRNETAMLWLAKIARSQKERRQWLERVLQVNPDNETAQKAIAKMSYNRTAMENKTLFVFGAVAAFMIVMVIIIIAIAALS